MSTYTPIASQTLSSDASSVIFSGIPQNYTDLVLVGMLRSTRAGESTDQWTVQINEDTGSNYSGTSLDYGGSSRSSSSTNFGVIRCPGPTATAGVFGYGIINFMNYSNSTTYKTALFEWSEYTFYEMGANVGLWRNTNAITSLKIVSTTGSNFASGSTFNLYGIANAGITNAAKATGGESVYTDGTYWYHIFRSSGVFAPNVILSNVDFLVIAGGGSGGYGYGGAGGGGAGGYRTSAGTSGGGAAAENKLSLAVQNYTVTVGAGGAADSGFGNNGSNSVFSTITSIGGGVGGRGTGGGYSGQNGGSGGGGGSTNRDSGGSGTANQGYNGGSAENSNGGGGGGGAGAVGANANNGGSSGGAGGSGVASSITGSSITRAGGGGGGAYSGGSAGGGGAGGGGSGGGTGGNGTASTGSGGGGGGYPTYNAGNGGSGIVIVRYSV